MNCGIHNTAMKMGAVRRSCRRFAAQDTCDLAGLECKARYTCGLFSEEVYNPPPIWAPGPPVC